MIERSLPVPRFRRIRECHRRLVSAWGPALTKYQGHRTAQIKRNGALAALLATLLAVSGGCGLMYDVVHRPLGPGGPYPGGPMTAPATGGA
ncbi:MAG: hypothetical protein ACOC46_04370, partial [Pirellulales bacterium]